MNATYILSRAIDGRPGTVSRTAIAILALVLAAFTPPLQEVHAQGTVSGTVSDAETGEPLPGVNIVVVGTQLGTATGVDGRYTIADVPAGTYAVRASYVGFTPMVRDDVVVASGQTTQVDFGMRVVPVGLEEVTVIGYGAVRREDVTGSLGIIDAENISAMPLVSPDQALQGQVAGVTVQAGTGIPGGGPQIQVRGTGNVGAGGQPLYVVDGFALPQPSARETLTRNPLADIPPEDIESITILKDASATAIYGSRASNGVVIITTKGGTADDFQLNVSAYTGMNQTMGRMVLDAANAREFATYQKRIWEGRVAEGVANEIPEPYRNPEQYGEGTDWWNEITRTARQHNLQVSLSGGSPSMRSYFSAGYVREEGVMLNTDYNRVSLRANVEADLSDKITAGLRVAPSYVVRNLSFEGGNGRSGSGGTPWMMTPLAPVYLDDGSYHPQPGADGYPGYSPGVWSQPNPVQWLMEEEDRQQSLRALTSAFVDYEIVSGLSVRQSLNADYRTSTRNQFRPSVIGRTRTPPPSVPSGFLNTDAYLNWLSETTLNLARDLGPGRVDALAGFTAQHERSQGSFFRGQFPDDEIRTLNVASRLRGTSGEQEWSLLSGLGRINYNLLDRFVFTGTIRSDGSSRFGELNRWGTFPSGAVAWNLHNESFMQGFRNDVPELRIRGSYGVTGNNQIGNYSHLGVVSANDYIFSGNTAAGRVLNSMGNAALSWEKTQEFNLGLDAALYDYRLRLALEVYQRNTTNLLLNRELPYLTGFNSVTQNLGEIRNRGVELSLHSVNVSRDRYSWTTDFNISLNRNEVVDLPGGADIRYGGAGPVEYMHREGLPMASYVGYVIDGLYLSDEMIASMTSYPGAVPGSFIIRDLNSDGQITEDVMFPGGDFAYLGDAYPDLTFGMTNSWTFGRIGVRALITGSFGGDNMRSEFFRTARNIDGLFIVDSDYIQNMWVSPQQPGDGLTPTVLGGAFGRQQYRDTSHSLILSDASHIWMRNLMVRYSFAGGMLAGSSVYLSGNNLFILSPYPGNPDVMDMDEANQQPGMDFGNYPIPRTFTFGVELAL